MKWMIAALAALFVMPPAWASESILLEADPWCPHTCEAGTDKPGYMVEVAREVFTKAGFKVTYKTVAWAKVMKDVRAGRADGAVGALAAEAPDLALHDEPLGVQSNAFVVRAADAMAFDGLGSIGKRVVGTTLDYSYSEEIDAWLVANKAQVRPLGGSDALVRNLAKLDAKRIDVVVDDEAVLNHTLRQAAKPQAVRVAGRMPGGALHVAFTQAGDRGPRYARILSDGITELRRSGRLAEILARYGLTDWKKGP